MRYLYVLIFSLCVMTFLVCPIVLGDESGNSQNSPERKVNQPNGNTAKYDPTKDISITPDNNPSNLLGSFLIPGTGITVTSVNIQGAAAASGHYTGGPFGISDGIILASGEVTNALPPNTSTNLSTNFGLPGCSECDWIIPGYTSYDAVIFTVVFDVSDSCHSISFDFVFGSEEYPEYVGSSFNDVFGAYLNGSQISFDNEGYPITINGPFFSGAYVVTPPENGLEYDGSTMKLKTIANVTSGSTNNTLVFVVCDAGDHVYDSGVLLAELAGDDISGGGGTGIPPEVNFNGLGNCGDTLILPINELFTFDVTAEDNGPNNDQVTLTVGAIPATASLTPPLPLTGNPVTTTFSWTPQSSDIGVYVVDFTAFDAIDGLYESCEITLIVGQDINMQTQVEPQPLFAFYAYALDYTEVTFCLGDIDQLYDVNDIDTSSLMVNGTIPSTPAVVLPEHPDFSGEVCMFNCSMRDFILYYGLIWDNPLLKYQISGQFNNGQPFVTEGLAQFIGHISGDLNSDGVVDISDMTFMINYHFFNSEQPRVPEVADVNGSGETDIGDIIYFVEYFFSNGPPPIHP